MNGYKRSIIKDDNDGDFSSAFRKKKKKKKRGVPGVAQ